MSLRDFLDELSSESPAPGGGSVSALAASAAAALAAMVAVLSHTKKGFESKQRSARSHRRARPATEGRACSAPSTPTPPHSTRCSTPCACRNRRPRKRAMRERRDGRCHRRRRGDSAARARSRVRRSSSSIARSRRSACRRRSPMPASARRRRAPPQRARIRTSASISRASPTMTREGRAARARRRRVGEDARAARARRRGDSREAAGTSVLLSTTCDATAIPTIRATRALDAARPVDRRSLAATSSSSASRSTRPSRHAPARSMGPQAFREALPSLTTFGRGVELSGRICHDLGDVDLPPDSIQTAHDRVQSAVARRLRGGRDSVLHRRRQRPHRRDHPRPRRGASRAEARPGRDRLALRRPRIRRRGLALQRHALSPRARDPASATAPARSSSARASSRTPSYYDRWVREQGITTFPVDAFDIAPAHEIAIGSARSARADVATRSSSRSTSTPSSCPAPPPPRRARSPRAR